MSGRYNKWHRNREASGQTVPPAMLNLGKKLLAQLDEQRRLAPGVTTLQRQITLSDGSVIRAAFVDGQPQVDYQVAPRNPLVAGGRNAFLDGIVTRPRNAGTTGGAADGQNAFGQRGHVLIRGRPGQTPAAPSVWGAYYFDAASIPEGALGGVYSTNATGEPLFDDGLVDGGTIDWRDGSEQLAVSWASRPGRASVRNAGILGARVFHNGIAILNSSILPSDSRQVACACLRFWEGAWYLLVVFSSNGEQFTAYRCAVHPDTVDYDWVDKGRPPPIEPQFWPRLLPIVLADCTRILDYSPDQSADFNSSTLGQVSFNQSGTEARCICPRLLVGEYGGGAGNDDVFEFAEIVLDFTTPELGEVTGTTTVRGIQGQIRTSLEVKPANSPNIATVQTITVDPPIHPGVFTGAVPRTTHLLYTGEHFVGDPFAPDSSRIILIPREATDTNTCAAVNPEAVPILVEYEDDTPVYLYWELGNSSYEYTWACDFSNTSVTTYSVVDNYVDGELTSTDTTGDYQLDATCNSDTNWTGSGQMSRFYAEDKAGTRWWDSGFEQIALSGSVVAEASLIDHRTATPPTDTVSEGTFTATRERLGTRSYSAHRIFHVDLRYRALMAGTVTVTSTSSTTQTVSGAGSTDPGGFAAYAGPVEVHTVGDTAHTSDYELEVYAYGVKVRSHRSIVNTSAPVDTTTTPTVSFLCSELMHFGFDRDSKTLAVSQTALPIATVPSFGQGVGGVGLIPYGSDVSEQAVLWFSLVEAWDIADPETRGHWDQTIAGALTDVESLSVSSTTARFYESFVQAHTAQGDALAWHALGSTAAGGLSRLTTDTETQLTGAGENANIAPFDGAGRMLTYKGCFAYSVFDLHGRSEVATRQWRAEGGAIGNPAEYDEGCIVTLNSITGDRDADLFGHMWPLSYCIFHKA